MGQTVTALLITDDIVHSVHSV